MATVGLVLHQQRPRVVDLARDAIEWLVAHDHEVRVVADGAARLERPDLACDEATFPTGLDLVVSLGGDGTMLRAVRLVAADDVDVLGIHVGHLGYLTEVEPSGMVDALARYEAGAHGIEERLLLEVVVDAAAGGPTEAVLALNEAVLEKTASGHTVRLGVELDGEFFTTYATDGLIVATPTGSTAYAFSVRGPIVAPDHRALLLTPVSPHMLFDRTLVLGPDATIDLTVVGPRPATLALDGVDAGTLVTGDRLRCRASRHSARLVTFGPRQFHRILKAKFGLNDR
jgi:NAD+ kinase